MVQGWAEQLNQTSARARLGAENWMTNLQANSKNIKMPKFGMPGAAACACLPRSCYRLLRAVVVQAYLFNAYLVCARLFVCSSLQTGLDLAVQ